MKFVNRSVELAALRELQKLSLKKLFLIALYGLRRVGKTRLLLEFQNGRGLYFFVNRNKASKELLAEYEAVLREKKFLGELEGLPSWDAFFDVLVKRGASPVVFDEFQDFSYVEPSVFGILQKTADLHENTGGLFILSGSLIGLVRHMFEDSREPLYGRIKKGMRLGPLTVQSIFEMGRELDLSKEETIKLYAIFGGYPKYYVAMEDFALSKRGAEEIISRLILDKDAPLEDEIRILLSGEFGARGGLYYSILEEIAQGGATLSSISARLGVAPTSITRQVGELRDYFELIGYEMPFWGKRGRYFIRHPLMAFWFHKISRRYSDYASRNPELMNAIKKDLNSDFGHGFEKVMRDFAISKLGLTGAGRQWGKIPPQFKPKAGEDQYEIDLIGKKDGGVVAFEMKYKALDARGALAVLGKLKEKLAYVPGLPRDAKLGIIASKLTGKKELAKLGYLAYDIDDL